MIEHKEKLESILGSNEAVSAIVLSICATMFDNGVRLVHVGGLMRMLGISNELASEHDEDALELPEDFYEQLAEIEAEEELQANDNITIN